MDILDLVSQLAKYKTVEVEPSKMTETCNEYVNNGYVCEKMDYQVNGNLLLIFKRLV